MFFIQYLFKRSGSSASATRPLKSPKGSCIFGKQSFHACRSWWRSPYFFYTFHSRRNRRIWHLPMILAASCEMTADLMRFTGNELHLQQSDVAIGSKRFISRLNPGCTRARRLIYLYFITFFIFMQIPADMFWIFVPLPVQGRDNTSVWSALSTGATFPAVRHRLACQQKAARVAVQTVAHARPECPQVLPGKLTAVNQVADHILVCRYIIRTRFLRQHACRFCS